MRGYLQRVALLQFQLLYLNIRFHYSWKMGKCGNLPVSLRIVFSTSIKVLFQGPGVLLYHDGCSI